MPSGDGDPDRHFLVHQHRFLERLDVDELEQLEPVQLALAFAQIAARESIARLERQLPADHVLADAGEPPDIDFAEPREHAGCRVERQPALPWPASASIIVTSAYG